MIKLTQECTSTFSLNFGGENEIDLELLNNSLSSVHCLLQMISNSINDKALFNFKVSETRKGSFEIDFITSVSGFSTLFTEDNINLAYLSTTILVNMFLMKDHLKGLLPKKLSTTDDGKKTIVVNAHDQAQIFNTDVVNIYIQSPAADNLIKQIFEDNDREADELRGELKAQKTFLLNLMSSPGSGKTTTLKKTIALLKDEMKIGVMEADIDSDVDAAAISETGVKVIQLHTGGMCHLDAGMTKQGLEALETEGIDLAILENVGNLVCPAEFDTGSSRNAMILSVPEGDDKPLKYPLMFSVSDVLLINKTDVLPYFEFDMEACMERARKINPDIKIIPVCARTGEGMEEWADWLRQQVREWKE